MDRDRSAAGMQRQGLDRRGAVIMYKTGKAFTSARVQTACTDPLRGAVRRALRLSTGVIAAGLALGVAPIDSAEPFPAVFPFATLPPGDGSGGFVLIGIDSYDESGYSVSAAGDVNGDGIDDIVIGAPHAHNYLGSGASYVVFGRTTGFPAFFPLKRLLPDEGGDGSAGFVLSGNYLRDSPGFAVSEAGDVNGDGIDDVIIGAS